MKIIGGEAVVKSLVKNKVNTIFGLPGSNILNIYNYLRDEKSIKTILVMHENNAAVMADVYGRLTGRPGVCLLTAGPGVTNSITGVAQAYTEASPVIIIAGHNDEKKKHNYTIKNWNFQLNIFEPITKWSIRITRVEDISSIISEAFSLAVSGRPGPVYIEVPYNILMSFGELIEQPEKQVIHNDYINVNDLVLKTYDFINIAKNPIVIVGKGILREFCTNDVINFARKIGAPILSVPSALSAIPYDCSSYLGYDYGISEGSGGIHPLITHALHGSDLIITLGLDIGERISLFKDKNMNLIHVYHDNILTDENKCILENKILLEVPVRIKKFIQALYNMIKEENLLYGKKEKMIYDIKNNIKEDIINSIKKDQNPIHPGEISTELRELLDDDAIVTLDLGINSAWMKLCYKANKPNTILSPGNYNAMGFALPAAISTKLTFPEKTVVAVTGDGGFVMSYMDFPTLMKYDLDITVIVQNNQQYGMIWQTQQTDYNGRTFSTELATLNFSDIARSFGANGIKIASSIDLRSLLKQALELKGPTVVDISTEYTFPYFTPFKTIKYLRKIRNIKDKIIT